ncbi:MAG: DUF1997 domain-containing protein [Gomphosphaeria aponina SAG 52.96 = DSM 107014]|uniref:DUF1997 domain-containing protein n=1 Tax=Gomphosphaeria aponina SAG 52.96 = DSM 107014 TaxID=1521640 RepID=A0A941JRZ2_9CHRO|nr:DUF1997 domain-containing protein [Gomphosphaeria aponina SAG 52.96 = DSM 107014]
MKLKFTASESVEILSEEANSIQHYLRQPQRIVKAIANPNLMKQLSQERYELKMRHLNFLDMYHFQPTVILKVWTGASGTIYLKSEECEIKGIDYINDRFALDLKGKLAPWENQGKTYLKGKADLAVEVELPPPLWLTPRPFLEVAGNGLLKSVLLSIKQRLLSQLLKDYHLWVESNTTEKTGVHSAVLAPAENITG